MKLQARTPILALVLGLVLIAVSAQLAAAQQGMTAWQPLPGCTDSDANNYNYAAETDDGSCTYAESSQDDEAAWVLGLFVVFVIGMIAATIGYGWALIRTAQGGEWSWFVITLIFPPVWIIYAIVRWMK